MNRRCIVESYFDDMRSLVGNPIDHYSCFISYSSKDEALARRLHADLQSNRVRCWFAPEDLKIGGLIRTSIDESIRLHDKLLLILSQYSVASQWIEQEVATLQWHNVSISSEGKADEMAALYGIE